MAVMKLLLLVACVWTGSTAGHEFFSSMDQVMQLVEEERNLVKLFSSYIKTEEETLKTLQSDLQTLKLSVNSEDPLRNMNDSVVVYKLIRRLRILWLSILQTTTISLHMDYQEWLLSDSPEFPSMEDLDTAALGLIRLQEIYKLDPEDITKGTPFSEDEAFYLGKVAYQQKKFQHAFQWFLYSLKMLNDPESLHSIQSVSRQQLLEYLGSSAYHFGSPSVTTDSNKLLLHLDKIMQFVKTERNLLKLFSGYIDAEKENLNFLKSDLQTLKLLSDSQNPERTMSNPVDAYRLIRRLREDWLSVLQFTQISHYKDYQEWLHSETPKFPSEEDLEGAALGLLRLQEIYKFYPEDIAKETPLSKDEAFYVGKVAYQQKKFQQAFHWFLYSLKMLNHPEFVLSIQSITKQRLLLYLGYSAKQFGSLSVAADFYRQLQYLDPTNEEIRNELNEINRTSQPNITSQPDINTLNATHSSNSYEALCRGDADQRTSRRQRMLSCRYSTGGGNPRLILAPLKEEIEWDKPRIVRYHDMISDKEIEILKNLSRPYLSRSQTGLGTVSNIRISQSVFLKVDNIVVVRVNQRIADATGLSMETAEPLLVQNYGTGGRYEPHYDAGDDQNERIATFLIYMSDVEIGGATVFPKAGVALQPKKGSAVFWYNLHKNGDLDFRTEHAGCPVLRGNKWVANKWIHEFGQEFTRPCSLSKGSKKHITLQEM